MCYKQDKNKIKTEKKSCQQKTKKNIALNLKIKKK